VGDESHERRVSLRDVVNKQDERDDHGTQWGGEPGETLSE
jgi:hypothetical protein